MVFKKPKISTKDVMEYIKKKKTATYLELIAEFCSNENDRELRKFVAHNIRQKIYLQTHRKSLVRISKGKYKYNPK
jgi:cobalamin biosynthesis protein CbiD